MNRHRDFYKDFDQGDIATHPDDFYDEQDVDYDHGHGQEEYEFTCEQCGMFALGHGDAQTHQFFCRHCWEDYHQSQNQTPQKPQKQQNQSQPQSVPSSSKGKKKNKKKGKGKNNQTTNNNNVNNNTNNKNCNNKANNSKTDKKNSSNNIKSEIQTNKDQVLGDRPDFFGGFMDDTTIEENATIIENNNNNNNNISGPISDSSKTSKTSNTDNTIVTSKQEGQNACNKSIESNKSNKSNKNKNNKQSNKNESKNENKEEKKDEGYTYHGIRYVGMRIESQKEYLKQQKMKQELICKRFGIDPSQLDDTNNNDKSNEKNDKNDKNDKNENKNDDKREKLLKKSKEAKPHINLVVIGHVDAGKSTLMGHLLYKYGKVNAKTMHKYEKQATELNKSSFAYAFVLDVNEEERKRGITVDVSTNYFETENRRVTLLDSPGHKDFVPNMISGTAQADAAILVINANNNEFEAGFSERGQTREHALLAKSLGVSQLIVAINKMDMVDWNFERYKFIVEQLTHFLQKIGFPNKKIVFLPVSGLTGRNLLRPQDISKDSMKKGKNDKNNKDNDNVKNEWYKKESEYNSNLTLIELIDKLRPPSTLRHSIDYPLRMSITDIYRDMMGFMLTGKIYSGSIMTNQQILIQPTNVVCKIKTLLSVEDNTKDFSHNIGVSGDNIQLLVSLQGVSKSDSEMMLEQVKVGDMITVPHEPIQCVKKFECKIATTATLKVPFVKGQDIVVYSHSVDVPARLAKIIGIFDKKGETIVKKNARHVPADTTASVVIKIKGKKQSLCLDTYENHKQLGRVTIRREGETIAIGVVTNTQV